MERDRSYRPGRWKSGPTDPVDGGLAAARRTDEHDSVAHEQMPPYSSARAGHVDDTVVPVVAQLLQPFKAAVLHHHRAKLDCAHTITMCTPYCAHHTVHITLCTPHCAHHTVHTTLCPPHCAHHTVHITLCTPHCAYYTMHTTSHRELHILNTTPHVHTAPHHAFHTAPHCAPQTTCAGYIAHNKNTLLKKTQQTKPQWTSHYPSTKSYHAANYTCMTLCRWVLTCWTLCLTMSVTMSRACTSTVMSAHMTSRSKCSR